MDVAPGSAQGAGDEDAQLGLRPRLEVEERAVRVAGEAEDGGEGGLGLVTGALGGADAIGQRGTAEDEEAALDDHVAEAGLGVDGQRLPEDLDLDVADGHGGNDGVGAERPPIDAGKAEVGERLREGVEIGAGAGDVEIAAVDLEAEREGADEGGRVGGERAEDAAEHAAMMDERRGGVICARTELS
jgi:hypothetical protein